MENKHQPEKIADRFQIVEIIGSGGVGTVYKAIDPMLNKEVAVKVLNHNADGTTAARLQREAIAAGKLNHPHICRIDNFGQTQDGAPYMVMEYLKGQDLASKIKADGAIDLESALEIAIQICGALSYAHKTGIVHRDLKPANVLLLDTANDAVFTKLLDFGVATLESRKGDLTEVGAIVGSPLYMSPEQVKGEEAKAVSDIYSFGCMLFEMLTGKPPLKAESVIETLALHKNTEAPLLSEYGDYPPNLVALMRDCLAKDPADRPQNASDVLSRLENIQQEVLNPKEIATPAHDPEAELRELRKRRTIAIASILVGVMIVLGGGYIIKDVYSRRAIPETKVSKSPLQGVDDKYFGDTKSAVNLFYSDGDQSRGTRLRAIPDTTDDDMKVLKGRKFRALCMDGAPIDGSGFQYILDSGVEALSLELTRVSDKNSHYFAQMPRLRSISLYSDALTDKGITPMADLSKFSTMEIGSENLTDAGIAEFKNLQNITFLHLRGSKMTVDCLKHLGKLNKLKTITLDKIAIKGDLSLMLKNFPSLKSFSIEEPPVLEVDSLKSLANTSVKSLQIFNTKINAEQFKAITNNSNFVSLTFSNTVFDGEYFASLAQLKGLYQLNLHNMKVISMQTIEDLCKVKNLTHIEFARSDVNQKNLSGLLNHQSLQYLNFHDCILMNSDMTDRFNKEYKARWGREVSIYF